MITSGWRGARPVRCGQNQSTACLVLDDAGNCSPTRLRLPLQLYISCMLSCRRRIIYSDFGCFHPLMAAHGFPTDELAQALAKCNTHIRKNTSTSMNTPLVQTAVRAPTELMFRAVPARNQGTHLLHHRALQHRSRRQGNHSHHWLQLSTATCSPVIHNPPLHRITSLQLLFNSTSVLWRLRQPSRTL